MHSVTVRPRRVRIVVTWLLIATLPLTAVSCIRELVDFGVSQFLGQENRLGLDPGAPKAEARSFVNWETPHVSPLAMTPDAARLLAVNTADNRLEVFDLTAGELPHLTDSIPVGLDPVSVRARTASEAWVVNHISDSVSIVDLTKRHVIRTLHPGDEPTDVAFAAGRAFVVCSQINRVAVYELSDLAAPPRLVEIEGEDPRAIAVSAAGTHVFVTILESGNGTTIVPHSAVSDPAGPYGGQNPPPNSGSAFFPPAADEQAPQAPLGQIVKKDPATGRWLDDNGGDWSGFVTWDLHDHDLAVIDASTLETSYVSHLMNLNMHLTALPDGRIAVVGTEAINHVRFEPNVNAHFVRSVLAFVDAAGRDSAIPPPPVVHDLNPQLADAYAGGVRTLPMEDRAASIADPRAVVFSSDAQTGYVSGMGSNNVAVIDSLGNRLAHVEVGQGPTGLVLDEARRCLYVLNKFDATISVVDAATLGERGRVAFFDPTPAAVRAGRPFLYDARLTSGLGVTACAACHVDGRMDQIAWDLGDPSSSAKQFNQFCDDLLTGEPGSDCVDFHPLKGPMTTQTLQGIVGTEPLHWRGDRENLAEFNPAFVGLLGNDRQLTDDEMASFEAFLATLTFPPNPHRALDNSLRTDVGGDALRGRELFVGLEIDDANGARQTGENPLVQALFQQAGAILSCNRCHQLPAGTNQRITSARDLNRPQGMKVPQLRNIHEKTGFLKSSKSNNRGFGFTHDGSFATVDEFLRLPNFHFGDGVTGEQNRADVIAFVMSLSTDTHAGVGMQVTFDDANEIDPFVVDRITLMQRLADEGHLGLVVRTFRDGRPRGYSYVRDGVFQCDREGETVLAKELWQTDGQNHAVTWTVVPLGSEMRIGVDRDEDGIFDGDQ